ncbi:MAG: DNA topoisomerase 4 subunit A [Oscillatoria sp. Prado101]|jgi:DNA gyrase subunit A|nr:DNA topoisomerase 4 subunit A [Oscillatoria sp. Prado101]
MAKQLNLLSTGQVIGTALHTEMQQSYLEYAMSVIVGRALPDVRDGLKPVHRRIMYAMHELGLTPDRPYRKCARVVGDVLGKYHPHGDQAVYDAMVRMVQDFSSRYPLLAGHGNFGSVDNDPPAAMRYTETRLAPIGHEALLSEIDAATVDFTGNFDNSQQEPVVLPAQVPVLLLNGSSGIAVGMATNIPPHNLGEIVDGLIALTDHPDLPDEKLFELIPGPDFPTGGEIVDTEGIRTAYTTGRGSIPVRGITKVEEVQAGKGRHRRNAIVVTELPYQVNKAAWIEKMAELVNQGRIEGIADIRDESDREGMRVVIELKRETDPANVLQQLYQQTALQSSFGAILLALVNNQPRQMTLREMLQHFLSFREQTLTRRYTHELNQTENRLQIVEGLLSALGNLDAVIDILRNAPDGSSAKTELESRLSLSDRQAEAILAMPLRRLTALERQNLQTERHHLTNHRQELQRLLSDRRELLKALKKDLRSLKKKYGDPRRTRINPSGPAEVAAEPVAPEVTNPVPEVRAKKAERSESAAKPVSPPPPPPPPPQLADEEVILEFTHRGYVRRLSKNALPTAVKQKAESPAVANDWVTQTLEAKTNQMLLVLAGNGIGYGIKVRDIPPAAGGYAQGVPVVSFLPAAAPGYAPSIVAQYVLPESLDSKTLVVLTQRARIKRVPLDEFAHITSRGLVVVKLKEDDALLFADFISPGEEAILATCGGRLLRFQVTEEQVPVMGRGAQGHRALWLSRQEKLVGCAAIRAGSELLLVSELGYGKRLSPDILRQARLGDIGTQALQFVARTDLLAGMLPVSEGSLVVLATSADRLVRLPVGEVPLTGKNGTGDRVPVLQPDERVVSLVLCSQQLDG